MAKWFVPKVRISYEFDARWDSNGEYYMAFASWKGKYYKASGRSWLQAKDTLLDGLSIDMNGPTPPPSEKIPVEEILKRGPVKKAA